MMFSQAAVRRCRLGPQIGTGVMARVQLGKLRGPGGFGKLVAVKRLRSDLARDRDCTRKLAEEGRIGSAFAHPNVACVVGVLEHRGQPLVVMDYIHGETLARLLGAAREREAAVPVAVARRVLCDVLRGLHAAHTARTEATPLGIVHRDVSTQQIMVGADGIARVLGFEVATAASGASQTTPGTIRAKRTRIAPEQVHRAGTDFRANVFAAGGVLWEMLSGQRLFTGETAEQVTAELLAGYVPLISLRRADVGRSLDDVVQQALSREPAKRFASALQFAEALEATGQLASRSEVAAWVRSLAGEALAHRAKLRADFEASLPRARPSRSTARGPWLPALCSNVELFARPAVALVLGAICLLVVGCLSVFERAQARSASLSAALPSPPTAPVGKPCVAVAHAIMASRGQPEPGSDMPPPLRPESLPLERRAERPGTRAYAAVRLEQAGDRVAAR